MNVKRLALVMLICAVLFLVACSKVETKEETGSPNRTEPAATLTTTVEETDGTMSAETGEPEEKMSAETDEPEETITPAPEPKEKYVQENLGRDEEAVKRFLQTFPEETAGILEEGKAACALFTAFKNSYLWEEFLAKVRDGEEACVVVMRTTDEGDPLLSYVHYDGTDFWQVYDTHRDHFGTPEYLTTKHRYIYEHRAAGYDYYEVEFTNEPIKSEEESKAYWDKICNEYFGDEYKEPIDEDGYILAPVILLQTHWQR